MNDAMGLFRKEVFEARRKRLLGEVILIQPLSGVALTLLLAALAATVAIAMGMTSFARTETVRGYLTPNKGFAQIYPMKRGLIEAVLVSEGDAVEAGDILIRIRAEQADASGQGIEARQVALLNDQLALMDKRIAHAHAVAEDRSRELTAEIEGIEKELLETEQRLKIQRRITHSAQESFRTLNSLLKRGYVSRADYEKRRQESLNQQAQETTIRQALAGLHTRLEKAKQELTLIPETEAESVRALTAQRAELEQRLVTLEGQQAYTLTSPISGQVTALQAARGRVADPSRPLALILPDGGRLEAELLVPSRAIGFVRPDQIVRLQYDAFPYQRFGTYDARIRSVTRTVLSPDDVSGPLEVTEPVYRITADLFAQEIKAYGQEVPLQAGMTLTARIVIERRSFMDWLLEPVRAVRGKHDGS